MKRQVIPFVLLVTVAATAEAENESPAPYLDISNKHTLLLGYTRQQADVEFSGQRDPLPEASIDLDDLGTDDSYNSWLAEYRYRLNERWSVGAGAFTFEVDGRRAISRDFNFDGVEFEAGASVETDIEVDTYILDVLYTAYRSERAELLVGGGLHMFDFSAELTGRVFAGDLEASRSNATDDILAPLPNLRVQGLYGITPKLGAAATLGWLSANYDNYDGDFLFLHARLLYRFEGGFGLSAGYQFTDIDVERDRSDGKNEYKIEFDGPTLQLIYTF
jgi:hypothetical protein